VEKFWYGVIVGLKEWEGEQKKGPSRKRVLISSKIPGEILEIRRWPGGGRIKGGRMGKLFKNVKNKFLWKILCGWGGGGGCEGGT